MNCKPMLAVDCGDVTALRFPLLASPKLDGVRAVKSHEALLSRTLKPIPNRHVQALYDGLPDGLDGELIAGDPTAPDVYRKTVSMVMSDDAPVDGLVYRVFDRVTEGTGFSVRFAALRSLFTRLSNCAAVELVPQVEVQDAEALTALETEWVGAGYEGVILRRPDSPYKHGRSTVRESYLLKLKRFADAEAEVIGVIELMHNGNAATTNALGRTARSHKKEGLTGAGVMGTLVVRDVKTGVEFEIGTGFTAEERAKIWYTAKDGPEQSTRLPREDWPLVKYKHFPSGAKDKPRHPVFLGWRDRRDT